MPAVPRRQFLQTTAALAALPIASSLWAADDKSTSSKKPLRVCLISGSLEYKSDESLARLQERLARQYKTACTRAFRRADDDLPGLEHLETCDVAMFFTNRLTLPKEQLDRVKAYCQRGGPIVGVRTASHGFQNWLEMDHKVLGGNYHSHYGVGPEADIELAKGADGDPVLAGIKPFKSKGSLYKNTGLAADSKVLLEGQIPEHREPVAWTRVNNGGRVFYTSLGHPSDFANPTFERLIDNALFWAAKRERPA